MIARDRLAMTPFATQLALILVLGVGAQWLAWRMRLPSILMLLIFGFLAGPILHIIDPDKLFGDMLTPMVSLFVALILFEGGMSLRIADLRQVGHVVRNLVTIGALLTGIIAALSGHWLLNLQWPLSVLLGSILLVTGPTVIGPLLRFVKPAGQVGPILRWEGIVIDPIGAMLSVLMFEAIHVESLRHATHVLALESLRTAGVGCGIGAAAALILILLLSRFWIPDHLQSPVALALVAAAFIASNQLQPESGLFTVTVMGIVLANQKRAAVHHIAEFKETLSLVLIASLFIILGARVQLASVLRAGPRGLLFLAVLVVIARPLSVWICTFRSGLSWREKAFLCAMAPRGIVAAAVSSVFALRLRDAQIPGSELLVPYTFVVIVGTVIIYGLTAKLIARRLKLSAPTEHGCLIAGANPLARAVGAALQEAGHPVLLVDTNRSEINKTRLAGLPTFYGSIIAPDVLEKLDLSGLGKLLALTPNDEVNSLAALRFTRVFGRSNVYQLPPLTTGKTASDVVPELRGRPLFGESHHFATLADRLEKGETIKKTLLTPEFDAKAFTQTHPDAVPLFLLAPVDQLIVLTGDLAIEGKPTMTIVSLAPSSSASPARAPDDATKPVAAPV
jgi:NhaP-type Na+/H+ or K+/H+ antiporter